METNQRIIIDSYGRKDCIHCNMIAIKVHLCECTYICTRCDQTITVILNFSEKVFHFYVVSEQELYFPFKIFVFRFGWVKVWTMDARLVGKYYWKYFFLYEVRLLLF